MKTTYAHFRFVLGVFVCLLSLTFIASIHRTHAAATLQPGNVIRVWSVGSPFSGVIPQTTVPADLQQQAEKLGYTIGVQNFRSAGFASILHEAIANHTEPEFITFTNLGILIGVNTPTGRYEGVLDTDYGTAASLQLVYEKFASLQPRGVVVLVRSAANYDAARALVMEPPRCEAGANVSEESLSPDLKQALDTAKHATQAFLGCDAPSLLALSDDAKLGHKCYLPNVSVRIDRIQPCGIAGNDRLAFAYIATTLVTHTNPAAPRRDGSYGHWLYDNLLGQQTTLAILRKQRDAWRLLAISDDPWDTNSSVYPASSTLQRLSASLMKENAYATIPTSALLTTADGANLRRLSQNAFENFEWTPSTSPDVIAEIVEFLISDNPASKDRTRLFFFLSGENRLSSGFLWGIAGKWRVLSINKAGEVSLTEPRSYTQRFGP
jgi:hypothetical protein